MKPRLLDQQETVELMVADTTAVADGTMEERDGSISTDEESNTLEEYPFDSDLFGEHNGSLSYFEAEGR